MQESGWNGQLYRGAADMIKVDSTVKLNLPKIRQLTQAQINSGSAAHGSYAGTGFPHGYRKSAK